MKKEVYRPLSNVAELHVEVSDSCNLHCAYCYFVSKKQVRTPFPIERFDHIIKEFFCRTDADVTLVFHGGEPLMNEAAWLDEACHIAKRHAEENGRRVCFHLQTNGSLLDDEKLSVLIKHGFTVNVSLDGPKDIHNMARGAYLPSRNAVDKLRDAGLLTGIITVIGKHNYNRIPEVVSDFISLGVKRYHFNVGSIVSRDESLILTEEEISRFLVDSYMVFLSTYKEICNWVLLEKLRRFVSCSIPDFACDSPICGAAIHKIHMKQDGSFYPCGSCVSTKEADESFCLGNITDNFERGEFEKRLASFHHLYFEHRGQCVECPAQLVCDFYCPAFDGLDPVTAENKCNAYKRFYEFLTERPVDEIESIVGYYDGQE